MPRSRLMALSLAMALAGASAVLAQEPPAAPAQHSAWDPAQMRDQMRARMEARRAERLKALHDVLAIRPDQEGAFQAFAAAVRPPAAMPGGTPRGMKDDCAAMANLTTPERLDQMVQRMQARMAKRQEALSRRVTAFKGLYAALSPEQRRTMDALPMLRGDHDERRGVWGRGRGWGRGGMDGRGEG